MNRNVVLGAAIVVVLLVGGGYMLFANKTQNPQAPSAQTANTTTGSTQKQSLKSFMSLANNQKCTFQDAEAQSSGTVYGGNGKVKGDFQSQVNGKTTMSHVFSDGQNVYMWTDGGTSGFKTSLASIEKLSSGAAQETFDVNKEVDYSCAPWGVDASVFVLPGNVTFQDMSAMMEDASKMMEEANKDGSIDKESACAACANLPASAQAQCKAALKCN